MTTTAPRERRPSPAAARGPRRRPETPVLVRQLRNGIEESLHRGDIVEADVDGKLIRLLGDPDRIVTLRSTVKPFGVVALIQAGGIEAFDLEPAEIAIMASSHSGEDLHVRTLQGVFRRAGVSQTLLACGSEGMPLDPLTAARLARDGEKPGAIRHMCSGQHAVSLLLARLHDWDPETYWQAEHPSQAAYRAAVAAAYGIMPDRLRTAIDGCGVQTYAFRLREVAQAYALLADPSAVGPRDRRSEVAPALSIVRDAMLANPEMVAGRHDRLDTSLMKAAEGTLISKAGMEALRADRDPARGSCRIRRRDGHGCQDRGRRRLRPGDLGSIRRSVTPGRRPRRPRLARAGPLPHADVPGPPRAGGGHGRRRVRARAGR